MLGRFRNMTLEIVSDTGESYPGQTFTFEVDAGVDLNGTVSIVARFVGKH